MFFCFLIAVVFCAVGNTYLFAEEQLDDNAKKEIAAKLVKAVTGYYGDSLAQQAEDSEAYADAKTGVTSKKKAEKAEVRKETDSRFARQSCFLTEYGETKCYDWSAAAGDGEMWVSADESAHADDRR